jgi:hypothetical protein
MTTQRMEHVGKIRLQGEGPVEGGWVDRVVGLEGVRAEIAMVETPDGHGRLELTKFHAPSGRRSDRHAPVGVSCRTASSAAPPTTLRSRREVPLPCHASVVLDQIGDHLQSGRPGVRQRGA